MLSAVVITKNEEKNIKTCLKSIEFVDEVILIDDYSSDNTLRIAKKARKNIKIFKRRLNNNFAQQRNFGLIKVSYEWVLFLDADERVTLELAHEIDTVVSSGQSVHGYFIKRIDSIFGKKLLHGETGNIKCIRLARKDAGEWMGNVHENWYISGITNTLIHPMEHYPHPTVSEFLSEIDFYSSLRAHELFRKNVHTSLISIIFYPKAKFFLNYCIKQGYKDGIAGFIYAVMMSFHSFLVRAKLYILFHK